MKTKLWIILILTCVGLAACAPQDRVELSGASVPNLQAWIDAPLPDSRIPLAPYTLIFHAAGVSGVDEFDVHINGISEAAIPVQPSMANDTANQSLYFGEYDWIPPAAGTYLLAVYAKFQGAASSPAQVEVVVGDQPTRAAPIDVEVPTETLEPSPTFTPTSEPDPCIFTALMGLNCREGPGIFYDYVDSFVKDQTAPVVGASIAGYHWYVLGPNNGQVCAVSNDPQFGFTTGICETQPQFTPPPTPIPTPTPTEELIGCMVRQEGEGFVCVYPCPDRDTSAEPCTP